MARDDLLEYFQRYAETHGLDLRTGTRVDRIERDGDAWRLETSTGPLQTDTVIVATGYNGVPYLPEWPGRRPSFARRVLPVFPKIRTQMAAAPDFLEIGSALIGIHPRSFLFLCPATRLPRTCIVGPVALP